VPPERQDEDPPEQAHEYINATRQLIVEIPNRLTIPMRPSNRFHSINLNVT
jgi:hypothetical protein